MKPLPTPPLDRSRLLISVDEAARATSLSRGTVERLYLSGEWPSIKVGGRRLIVLRELERWIEERAAR